MRSTATNDERLHALALRMIGDWEGGMDKLMGFLRLAARIPSEIEAPINNLFRCQHCGRSMDQLAHCPWTNCKAADTNETPTNDQKHAPHGGGDSVAVVCDGAAGDSGVVVELARSAARPPEHTVAGAYNVLSLIVAQFYSHDERITGYVTQLGEALKSLPSSAAETNAVEMRRVLEKIRDTDISGFEGHDFAQWYAWAKNGAEWALRHSTGTVSATRVNCGAPGGCTHPKCDCFSPADRKGHAE